MKSYLRLSIGIIMLARAFSFNSRLGLSSSMKTNSKLFNSLRTPEKLLQPSKLLDKTDCFIFDCDGVIWKGDSVIEGVPFVLEKLREMKKKIFFGKFICFFG